MFRDSPHCRLKTGLGCANALGTYTNSLSRIAGACPKFVTKSVEDLAETFSRKGRINSARGGVQKWSTALLSYSPPPPVVSA